jgi:hypothetical protein
MESLVNWLTDIIIPLVIGVLSSSIVVLIGVQSIKQFMLRREREREIGNLREFWDSGSGSGVFHVICGQEHAADSAEVEPRLGYSEAFGIMAVRDTLQRIFGNKASVQMIPMEKESELPPALYKANLVIFGGELSLNLFGRINRLIEVPYYQYEMDVLHRDFQRIQDGVVTERISSIVDFESFALKYDIGTVVRLVNPITRRLIVLLNGNYAAGLVAAITAITSKDQFPDDGFDPGAEAQQLVVGIDDIVSNMALLGQRIESVRGWRTFTVPEESFASMLNPVKSSDDQ